MKIEKPTKPVESYLQHRLHPRLTVEQIQAALPGIEDEGASWDGKVKHHWEFIADDQRCAVWDMRGLRWSAYGPREAFAALGFEVIGGEQDFAKAFQLAQEVGA